MSEAKPLHGIKSLSRQIMIKVLIFGSIIVAAATVICYYLVHHQTTRKNLAHLQQYMTERSKYENQPFIVAHERLIFFRDEFLKLYLSDVDFTSRDFSKLYFTDKDGAVRMKREYYDQRFDGRLGRTWGMSSFIGNNQPVDSRDFQRRLIIAHILANRYGPAWYPDGILHVTFPENAIVAFYPSDPWGLKAKPDLRMNELGTIKATLKQNNPERKPIWTGLYYDETVNHWTITYELPVDYQGRHLFNPSLDVHLEAIMGRLITDHPEGAYNFIIRSDGALVAHPNELKEELKKKGQLSLDEINNPDIVRMYNQIRNTVAEPYQPVYVIEDPEGDNYLLTSHITGPDWWFVMVYPKKLIAREANQTSRLVLLLGFSIFILYYAVISWVLNRKVRQPLRQLERAVSLVARGEYDKVAEHPDSLPVHQKNEIGALAGAFLDMSVQVRNIKLNLENIVESRTKELAKANQKLERLSNTDGLTGLYNRRYFDQYLQREWRRMERSGQPISILMCDIDFFKKYNDTYGHISGDGCIQAITVAIMDECKRPTDIATRFGGEEFAVILAQTDAEGALHVAEAIRKRIEQTRIPHKSSPVKDIVSLSIGVGTCTSVKGLSPESLVQLADEALYMSKNQGRDRVMVKSF